MDIATDLSSPAVRNAMCLILRVIVVVVSGICKGCTSKLD